MFYCQRCTKFVLEVSGLLPFEITGAQLKRLKVLLITAHCHAAHRQTGSQDSKVMNCFKVFK